MKWNRLQLSAEFTYRLRNAKGRTGLTPNLLCRLGFCLSLEEARVPDPARYDDKGLDFNRSTLLGEWEHIYEALLIERIVRDGFDPDTHFMPQLTAHMNRGAGMACDRLRTLSDVLALLPEAETHVGAE